MIENNNETLTIHLLKSDGLIKRDSSFKNRFNQKFSKKEIETNEHFKIKNSNKILQLNNSYRFIYCHLKDNKPFDSENFTSSEIMTVLKNLILKDYRFEIDMKYNTVGENYGPSCYEELGLLKQGSSTKSDYLLNLEKHAEYFIPSIHFITVEMEDYILKIHQNSLSFTINNPNKRSITLEDVEYILFNVSKLTELFSSMMDLEQVKMFEKEPQYTSKIEQLVNYLKDNKALLPRHILDILASSDLEKEISTTSKILSGK